MDPSLSNVLSSAEVQAFASGFPVMVMHLIVTLLLLAAGATVYALLTRADAGVAVGGRKMTSLPATAYSLLLAGATSENVLPIRRSVLAEAAVPTAFQVTGFRMIQVTVDGARE